MTMKECVKCGGKALRKIQLAESMDVAGIRFTGKVNGWRCASCRETYFDGPDLERFELAAALYLAKQGVPTGTAFRFMRKAIAMKASELAELLGVTPETISRYENGKGAIPPAALLALGDLVRDQRGTRDRLHALRTRPSRKIVRLAS